MRRPREARYAALAVVIVALGCSDAPTAPNAEQETVLVSLVGLDGADGGIVLRLFGAADRIEPAAVGLEVGWVSDGTDVATVAIIGPIEEGADVLVVRGRPGVGSLRAEVREAARADGALWATPSARAIVRAADGRTVRP